MGEKEMAKQRIIALINTDVKKAQRMDEETLMRTIADIDQIRVDAVRDGRFLGELNRRRERKTEIKTTEGSPQQVEEK